MATAWFYKKDDKEFGPITAHELRALAESNSLAPDDLVKTDNTDRWVPARRVSGLFQSLSIDSSNTGSEEVAAQNESYSFQNPQHIHAKPSETFSEPNQDLAQTATQLNPTNESIAPSTPKEIAAITLSDLQRSALLGILAAIPSWLFFGNMLHLVAGGAIAGITMTFTALRLGINIEDYQSRLFRFIVISMFIFIASWWLGTASIPIASVALYPIAWMASYYSSTALTKMSDMQSSTSIKTPEIHDRGENDDSRLHGPTDRSQTIASCTLNSSTRPKEYSSADNELLKTNYPPIIKTITSIACLFAISALLMSTKCGNIGSKIYTSERELDKILNNMTQQQVLETFGNPDSIFNHGTLVGQIDNEVWTYNDRFKHPTTGKLQDIQIHFHDDYFIQVDIE